MSLELPIYLDSHATTPLDPRVLESMLPFLKQEFGNAASRNHVYGWNAATAVDVAREQAAAIVGASSKEIVWTSGATESDNLAVLGVAEAYRDRGDHVVTCVTEHRAVLDCATELERRGFRVTYLSVDTTGLIDLDELAGALEPSTLLVSIMAANNEIGTLQPIGEISKIVKARSKALFHTDAVQAVGKIPLDVEEMGIDLLSMSGHKIYGPKGVGALYVRRRPRVRVLPVLHGGGHERGMRSGTLNVPAIVGMGRALEIAGSEMQRDAELTGRLRDALQSALLSELDGVHLNGHRVKRLPNNLNVSFERVEAEALLQELPDVALSTGAACSSASLDPSHVIRALGLGESRAQSSLRFGLHRFNTEEEIDFVARETIRAVRKLRGSPVVSESVGEPLPDPDGERDRS